ncbi:MAG TPA: ABC transporter ATP-binding protein [Bacteroidales bacterium]|nr:ABC transporter ATP-binding protein [Bacteroidales bacterium]
MEYPSIAVRNISRSYGSVKALDRVSFEVPKGELFGFIGPDGAGKTTLFRILATLVLPDEGLASVEGFDVVKDFKKIRKILGYMPGRFSLYMDLSVEENLSFYATIFGTTIKENYDQIKEIYRHIEPFKTRRAGKLSGGMKQKLALCCALIHKPAVIFLDEPTTGVDAVSRMEFWEMLRRLKENNITIMVSTPYMDEASLCDRVALIQDGKIMKISRPEEILADYRHQLWAVRSGRFFELLSDLHSYPGVHSVHAFGQTAHVSFDKSAISVDDLRRHLINNRHTDVVIEEIKPTIEDCFMELMAQ